MLKIVFCDDNAQFLTELKAIVEDACQKQQLSNKDYEIGPAFGSGKEAINYIKKHHVDVLLLDIGMPEMDGLEVAKVLCKDYTHIKIVFMSSQDDFVYSVFDYCPFAYMRKALISKEFPKVLTRILEKTRESDLQLRLATTDGVQLMDANAIAYVESSRNYISVYLIHGKTYTSRSTLSNFETEVAHLDFYRIHSSFLINLEHVERILDNGYVLVTNKAIPIAQRRLSHFKKIYMSYIKRKIGTI